MGSRETRHRLEFCIVGYAICEEQTIPNPVEASFEVPQGVLGGTELTGVTRRGGSNLSDEYAGVFSLGPGR